MHHRLRKLNPIKLVIGLAVVTSGLIAVPSVVNADQFTPLPDPPQVEITSTPGASFASAIQPQFPRSSGDNGIYTVTATVTTNATLAALEKVSMCWYKVSAGTDALCTATPDPKNAFQMVWTEATAAAANEGAGSGTVGFAVTGTNAFVNVGSQVETTANTASYNKDAQSMTIKFSFRVSNAMLAGSDWAVKVSARYDNDLCGGSCPDEFDEEAKTGTDEVSGRNVAYWGEMTTARAPLAYGVIAPNQTSNPVTASAFEFVANAPSDFTMTASDFTHDPDGPAPADVIFLTTGSPGISRARLDCRAALGQTNANTSFIPLEIANVSLGATIVPTGETINTTGTILCTLQYGSGAQFALREYSNTVTLALVQSTTGSTIIVTDTGTNESLDTIQEAINLAKDGDTVQVPAGNYAENLTINKRITLKCANAGIPIGATPAGRGDETNITGEAVVSAAGVEIDGCRFLHPQSDKTLAVKLISSSGVTGVVTVKNSILDHAVGSDRSCGAGTFGTAAWRIFDNKFLNNGNRASAASGGCNAAELYNSRAVHAENSPRIIVRGNHFVNTGHAIYLTGSNANGSELINNLFTEYTGSINVGIPTNVLIKGNSFAGRHGIYLDGSIGTVVENNSFSGENVQAVWVDRTTSSSTFRFNIFDHTATDDVPTFFFNSSGKAVDARLNYWGLATGPGLEARVSTYADGALVVTSPWIASFTDGNNPDTRYTTGFWPTGIVEGR